MSKTTRTTTTYTTQTTDTTWTSNIGSSGYYSSCFFFPSTMSLFKCVFILLMVTLLILAVFFTIHGPINKYEYTYKFMFTVEHDNGWTSGIEDEPILCVPEDMEMAEGFTNKIYHYNGVSECINNVPSIERSEKGMIILEKGDKL